MVHMARTGRIGMVVVLALIFVVAGARESSAQTTTTAGAPFPKRSAKPPRTGTIPLDSEREFPVRCGIGGRVDTP